MQSIDSIVFSEAVRFLGRDRAKAPLVASLYASSFFGKDTGKITRATYFMLRHLDDALDGDMKNTDTEPLIYLDPVGYSKNLKQEILSGDINPDTKVAKLARYAIAGLDSRAQPQDNPRQDVADVIDAMIFDHERMAIREAHSSVTLREYYENMLNPSIDTVLIGLNSTIRSSAVTDFAYSQGRIYSIRDFKKDWQGGIINVPSEVLTAASLSVHDTYSQVIQSTAIQDWIRTEVLEAGTGMRSSLDIVDGLPDKPAKIMLRGLGQGALRFTTRRLFLNQALAKTTF